MQSEANGFKFKGLSLTSNVNMMYVNITNSRPKLMEDSILFDTLIGWALISPLWHIWCVEAKSGTTRTGAEWY